MKLDQCRVIVVPDHAGLQCRSTSLALKATYTTCIFSIVMSVKSFKCQEDRCFADFKLILFRFDGEQSVDILFR